MGLGCDAVMLVCCSSVSGLQLLPRQMHAMLTLLLISMDTVNTPWLASNSMLSVTCRGITLNGSSPLTGATMYLPTGMVHNTRHVCPCRCAQCQGSCGCVGWSWLKEVLSMHLLYCTARYRTCQRHLVDQLRSAVCTACASVVWGACLHAHGTCTIMQSVCAVWRCVHAPVCVQGCTQHHNPLHCQLSCPLA